MTSGLPLLSIIIFLPLVGVLALMTIRGERETTARNSRWVALWTSLATFIISLGLINGYDTAKAGFQFQEQQAWFPVLGISYHVAVDGVALTLILLSTLLVPICILASWKSIKTRVREYMIAFLVLETLMLGMFAARDALLFYVFFEAVLIPMFLIIGIWGGQRRVYAAFKFFLYTLLGSVLTLIALIYMALEVGSFDMAQLTAHDFAPHVQMWLWWAFFAAFAVKVPMWPVHTWLPDAHVEAPTAGSVILAGVLLKMGGYGFLRFSVPMLPEATSQFTPVVFTLSVMAIVYTSLVALVQGDMKKLIAYSSVAHMGYVTLGLFSQTLEGISGALFQMLSHGLISAALFLCVGVVYDRLHTREMSRYGGVASVMPHYALVFMVFMLASAGLPGTAGFVGEFLSLLGAFKASTVYGTLAASGIVLGAAYMLVLYRKVLFGKAVHNDVKAMPDLDWREASILIVLALLVFLLGIKPDLALRYLEPSSASILYEVSK